MGQMDRPVYQYGQYKRLDMLTDNDYCKFKYILYRPEGGGGYTVEQRVFDRRTDEPAAE